MNSWTIKKRIVFGFTTVIVIAVALGLFAVSRLNHIQKQTTRMDVDCLPGWNLLSQIEQLARENYGYTLHLVLAEVPADKTRYGALIQDNVARINQLTNDYATTITTTEDRQLFEKLIASRMPYVEAFKEVRHLSENGGRQETQQLLTSKLDPTYAAFMAALDAHTEFNRTNAINAGHEIDRAVHHASTGVWIGLATAFVMALVVSFAIIRSTNRALRSVSNVLNDGATQIASAASQVSATSQSLAEGASEQAASLEETSASLEEISSMTQRNAQNVQSAKDFTSQTRATAESGAQSTQEMGQAMQGIRTASGEMRDAMNGIKAASNDVSKIIKTIDEIAFQTNILALNAAVEAARAGEAGMGFAVVADEVRNLAQRSAKAAKETADMIETSIKRSDDGVRVTDKVASSVEEVVTKSHQLEQKLAEIVAKAQRMDEQVAQIALASQEQSQGIGEVNMAVTQMDKITQGNASNAEESAAAAEELNAQAEVLKAAVHELLKLIGGEASKPVAQPKAKAPLLPSVAFHANATPAKPHPKSVIIQKPVSVPHDHDFPMPEPIGTGKAKDGFTDF